MTAKTEPGAIPEDVLAVATEVYDEAYPREEPGAAIGVISRLIMAILADRASRPDQLEDPGAVEALQPFADAVFNDNGDMTVDASFPKHDDFVRAYFAHKRLSPALSTPSSDRIRQETAEERIREDDAAWRDLIRHSIAWANWCAGEGMIAAEGEDVTAPEDFLSEFSSRTKDEDWDTLADRAAKRTEGDR